MLLVVAAAVDLFGRRVEPVLFRPELGALALQTGRDHGVAAATLAGAIGLATLVVWRHNSKALGRAVALAQIALAIALLLDGVFAFRTCSGRRAIFCGTYGRRPVNAMSLVCSSASAGTSTRGPY